MLGGIYSEEKCSICGQGMRDDGRSGVRCLTHKKQAASTFVVRFGRKIKKRFNDYADATRFLNGLRFKMDEGSFDVREYQSGDPLAFRNLAAKYVALKQKEHERNLLAKGTLNAIQNELGRASEHFGTTGIKQIRMPELQEFFLSIEELSSKSIHNLRSNLHAFWVWLAESDILAPSEMPRFPVIEYSLGYRKTVDKDTQDRILDEVYRVTMPLAPRVYLAIRWLTIYVSIRPAELLKLKERNVDFESGRLTVEDHKTARKIKRPKVVPLLPYDVDFLQQLPRSFDRDAPLFRHDYAYNSNLSANDPFGNKILYRTWKKACLNLGIQDVDLYGGTRHSTMQFYRQHMSTEDVLRLSSHTTSKAGMRYLEVHEEELRAGFELTNRLGVPDANGTPGVHAKGYTKIINLPKP